MSEVNLEGFDIGGDDSAVDDAFATAFRRAEEGDTGTREEVTPDEESAASEQPRDENGRFANRMQPEVTDLEAETAERTGEEEAAPAVEERASTGDPIVDEYLSKYNGDLEAAVKAAAHQSTLLGRQADEVGQLRAEIAQMREQLQSPQQPAVPITAEAVEELESIALENPHAALARASQMGDPTGQLAERVMDIWFAVNPRAASAFQAAAIAHQTEQRVRAELQPITQERAQTAEDQAYLAAWDLAKSKQPSIDELAPAMKDVLEARPGMAKAVVNAETPEERADLFLAAFEIASKQAGVSASQVREVATQQIKEQARAEKVAATVAKPSAVGSAPGAAGGEEPSEGDVIKAGLLRASGTDILSGWSE